MKEKKAIEHKKRKEESECVLKREGWIERLRLDEEVKSNYNICFIVLII